MEYHNYCTACLVTDVKMTRFRAAKLNDKPFGEVFCQFLQIPHVSGKEVGSSICYECVALVIKFEKFRSKCLRAQVILSKLEQDNLKITKESIQSINRKEHKLTSTISVIPTESLSKNGVQNENDISKNCEQSLVVYNTKPEIDCIKNSIDISLVKNEEQDIHENTTNKYENDSDHFDKYSNDDYTTSEKNLSVTKKKRKTKIGKKEHKHKKRKLSELKKNIVESLSDDEPVANKVSKTTNKVLVPDGTIKKKSRKSFDINYFEGYATVVFLTPEDAKKELLLRKESSNYIISPMKCEFCYRGYEAKAAYDNHMKRHSNDYGEFKCDICQLRFSEQRCLCKHRLTSHKRKFCCKLCTYVCFSTHQAKTHVSLHKGKKYPCEECKEIFSMPNSLHMHKRLKHGAECVCELCGNTFATPKGLYLHVMKVHRQEKNEKLGPKCEDCGIHFSNEEAWKRHLVLSSKHNVSNGCKNCGETFLNTEELKFHMRVHARKHPNRGDIIKLPATCTICDKYLVNRTEFKSHMMSEHPHSDIAKKLDALELTPFVCELCGLAFKKQCFLTYHQRKHTGERPYSCGECGKRFPLAAALAAHRASHAARRHACRLCGRVLSYKSALNKHMKVHLNIRPHRCDICDKAFISPCDVRLHIKYVHNKVPWPKRDRTKRNMAVAVIPEVPFGKWTF